MKNYAKVGGKKGRPAYRTPSSFIARKTRKKLIKDNLLKLPVEKTGINFGVYSKKIR